MLLLLACHTPDASPPKSEPSPAETAAPVDSAVDTLGDAPDSGAEEEDDPPEPDPTVTEESADTFDESTLSDWLFTLDTIHQIDITLPEDTTNALASAPYDWSRADVSIDGEELTDVGVRLRGKIGSYRTLSGKPKFKLSFNEFVEDRRFYGLEELSLNNAVVDCSYMKEVIGYHAYELAGVPTLRTGYARVYVNGADYGLYVLIETPNDRWLKRNYADASGNLYDGKYVWYGGYSYTLLDFGDGVDSLYQLEEGTDVGNADIAAVSAALLSSAGTDAYFDTMDAVIDWDDFHRMTAVDQLIGHNDGYSMNTNNYRVYFDPSDGKADFLPWDLDYTFLYDYQWGMSWYTPYGNVTYWCWQNRTCRLTQQYTLSDFLDVWEAEDWNTWFDQVAELTYADTQNDPRRECAASDVQTTRDYMRAYLASQPTALRTKWHIE